MTEIKNQIFSDLSMTKEARQVLDAYVSRLEAKAGTLSGEDSTELVRDIKEHLYNALEAKLKKDKTKLDTLDAQTTLEVLGDLGEPEEYFSEITTEEGVRGLSPVRKLRRAREGKVFAGVALGIANYFHIDVVIVRILFVVLTLAGMGFPVLLYIALWAIVPEGDTLEKEDHPSVTGAETIRRAHPVWRVIGRICLVFLYILLVVAVYLPIFITLLVLTIVFFALPFVWLAAPASIFRFSYINILGFWTPVLSGALGLICLFFFLAFISFLMRVHFRRFILRGRTWRWLGIAAVASFGLLCLGGSYVGLSNMAGGEVVNTRFMPAAESLEITVADSSLATIIRVIGEPDREEIEIREIRQARGWTREQARNHAQNIQTDVDIATGKITVGSEWNRRWTSHFETLTYEIAVPEHTDLIISNPLGTSEVTDVQSAYLEITNTVGSVQLNDSWAEETVLYAEVGGIIVEDFEPPVGRVEAGSGDAGQAAPETVDTAEETVTGADAKGVLPAAVQEEKSTSTSTLKITGNVGSIVLEDVAVDWAEVSTETGSVSVRDCQFRGVIRNNVGAIEVIGHAGELEIIANVGSLDISLFTVKDGEQYRFSTDVGSIDLELPRGLNPIFSISTDVGGADNGYDVDKGGERPEFILSTETGSIDIE
ncbi:MAG TPA: PspC domain-containing protein [bacterium]|nr:PspC domain-containing protein [bacterium]